MKKFIYCVLVSSMLSACGATPRYYDTFYSRRRWDSCSSDIAQRMCGYEDDNIIRYNLCIDNLREEYRYAPDQRRWLMEHGCSEGIVGH